MLLAYTTDRPLPHGKFPWSAVITPPRLKASACPEPGGYLSEACRQAHIIPHRFGRCGSQVPVRDLGESRGKPRPLLYGKQAVLGSPTPSRVLRRAG